MSGNIARIALLTVALSLGGCFGAKRDVAPYVARAAADRAAGDTAKAAAELHDALRIDPRHPAANLMLAQIEEGAGDLHAAIPHYVLAAAPDARLIEPQLRVVEFLTDAKRYDDALARINATLGVFPNNAQALAIRADVELQSGQAKAARSDAGQALQLDPWSARALAVVAQLELYEHDVSNATTSVAKGLSRHPDDIRLLQVQASIFLTESQPDKAASALKTILRESPRSTGALVALAQLEAETGHYDDALDRLRAAATADPSNTDLQVALISFLSAHAKPEQVESRLKELIAEHKDENIYDLLLAQYYRQQGANDLAEAALRSGLDRLNGKTAAREVQVALAKLDLAMGRLAASQSELASVLAADPTNVEALLTRAVLARSNGNAGAAITDLLAAVRADPVNEQGFQLLAAQYLLSGQPRLAVEAMQRAVSITPEDKEANARLAIFLQSAGQIDRAKEIMSGLLLANPDSPEIATDAARLALMRKDIPAADRALARLRAMPNASAMATFVGGQIAMVKGDQTAAASAFRSLIEAKTAATPDVIQSFTNSSIASGQAAVAAQFLSGIGPALPADAQASVQSAQLALWIAAGDSGKATQVFDTAIRAAPDDLRLYQTYVTFLLDHKEFDEAVRVIDAGLKTAAPRWSLLLLRGVAKTMAGQPAAALADFKTGRDLNPGSVEALNDYASTLADVSPSDKTALEQARNAFAGLEGSTDTNTIDTMAWLDYRLGRFDEAKALLTRIKAGQSEDAQIRFHLAAVLLALGEKDQGLTLLDTVKGLTFPGSGEARNLSAT